MIKKRVLPMLDSAHTYMCPKCHKICNVSTKFPMVSEIMVDDDLKDTDVYLHMEYSISCPVCQDIDMVPIDAEIITNIVRLNQMGFPTRFCCEGHWNEGVGEHDSHGDSWYIKFDKMSREKEMLLSFMLFQFHEWFPIRKSVVETEQTLPYPAEDIIFENVPNCDNTIIMTTCYRVEMDEELKRMDFTDLYKSNIVGFGFDFHKWTKYHDRSLERLTKFVNFIEDRSGIDLSEEEVEDESKRL